MRTTHTDCLANTPAHATQHYYLLLHGTHYTHCISYNLCYTSHRQAAKILFKGRTSGLATLTLTHSCLIRVSPRLTGAACNVRIHRPPPPRRSCEQSVAPVRHCCTLHCTITSNIQQQLNNHSKVPLTTLEL